MTSPRLIMALDVPTAAEALELVDRFEGRCDFYKVGLELFTAAGPSLVASLRARRLDVFLDLKLHDIPNTVAKAMQALRPLDPAIVTVHAAGGRAMMEDAKAAPQAARRAAAHDVRLLTVHASGGEAMLAAAVDGAGERCGILAVTVLTSLEPAELAAAWGRGPWIDVRAEVLRLAELADAAGAHGIVCAPLVPGIRPAGAAPHDQARIVTPEFAAAEGARYLIIGRAVTEAADPLASWDSVAAAVASVG